MAIPPPGAPPPYSSPPPPYTATPTGASPAQILHHFLTTSSYAHLLFPVAQYSDKKGKATRTYDLTTELEKEIQFEKAGMKLAEVLDIENVYGFPRVRINEVASR